MGVSIAIIDIMTTLVTLPEDIQGQIANFLRPLQHPLSRAPDVGRIKAVHPNLKAVPLWKNHEWRKHIREWRDENLTKMRWKYKYGALPEEMIKKGWESKINHIYRHQGCYVWPMMETTVGTGFSEVQRVRKIIFFEVSLENLISGIRPLPHCFGNNGSTWAAGCGRLLVGEQHFVPLPSLKTMIPKSERRSWLMECFRECILEHWGKIILGILGIAGRLVLDGSKGEKFDFMKEFKKIMELPSDYDLYETQLFRMFLKELGVRSDYSDAYVERNLRRRRSEGVDELCRQNFPYIRLVKKIEMEGVDVSTV